MRSLAQGERGRVYLHFSKAFDTMSNRLLIDKLAVYRLDKWTMRWIEIGPGGWWSAAQSPGGHPGCTQRPALFNSLMNDLDAGIELPSAQKIQNWEEWLKHDVWFAWNIYLFLLRYDFVASISVYKLKYKNQCCYINLKTPVIFQEWIIKVLRILSSSTGTEKCW